MREHSFVIGRQPGYPFKYDDEGNVRALPISTGDVLVIGGQSNLREGVATPAEWSSVQDETGNNEVISDGRQLYSGAGFDEGLIAGQVEDVMWALGESAHLRSGRLLELGCGPGFLLEALSRRLPGWSMVGVDPSPTSVCQAKGRGLDCHLGTLDTVRLQPGFNALVVMGNFQLHHDQGATLRRLAELAAPDATMFLDSKNPSSSARIAASWMLATRPFDSLGAIHAFAAHCFHGIRNAPTMRRLALDLSDSGWETATMRTTAPRLLRFDNRHDLAKGFKLRIWRVFDSVDRLTDRRAWIQLSARRKADD